MSDPENTSNESESFGSTQSSALLNLSDIDSIVSSPGFQSTSEVYNLSDNSSNEMVNPNSHANGGNSTDSGSFQDTSQSRSSPPTTSQNSFHSPSTNASDFVLQESLDSNVAAEIDRIRRFCENVEDNLASIGLGSASTPRIVRGNRPRLDTTDPVEIIDLSEHYEAARQLARNRPPDAFIDLCTPVAIPSAPSRGTAQRRRLVDPDPDCIINNSPSPPKRTCESANNSQKDNSYRCPVCLESVSKREPTSTKCGHVFCKVCIQSVIQSSHKCPMCNKKLTARQTFRIYL